MQEGEEFLSRPPNVTTSRPRRKTFELLDPFANLSLAQMYKKGGQFIGKYPIPFIIATAIMCSATLGMIGLKLKDNVRDGYTPTTSDARKENRLYREFLGSEGDPAMTTILMTAKDNGSMHRIEYLHEARKQWEQISKVLKVDVGKNQYLEFSDFCGSYCKANDIIDYFIQAYDTKLKEPTADGYQLNYPISTVMNYQLHLERNFFGVTTNDSDIITNIQYMKVLCLPVLSEVDTFEDTLKLGKWELEVFEFAREYTAREENILEITVLGAEIVDMEMNKDAQKMTPYFIIGFLSMVVFVFSSVYLSSRYYGYATWRILIVAFACLMVPMLAILTTFGTNNLIGNRTNSPMMIMPFLINGIGVNDAFLTLQTWLQLSPNLPTGKRLGYTLAEAGPSITTTTLTNVIVFLIGWMNPTEEMSIFCFGCAMSLLLAYIYTLTFFCPILVLFLTERYHEPSKMKASFNKYLGYVAKVVCHKYIFILLMIGSLVYWSFGIAGTVGIKAVLDTAKILPIDTPIRRPNRIIEEVVWKEFYPVTVFINNPINISNPVELSEFESLVHSFESMKNNRGSQFTISFLRDYQTYFYGIGAEDFDYDDEVVSNTSALFDYSKLTGFLGNPMYQHHTGTTQLNQSAAIPVRKMSIIFAYQNVSTWDDRINIMMEWRSIAEKSKLNVSVWNVNAMFVDQMRSLKWLAIQNAGVTLICMAAVCAVFIQTPISVLFATLSICSISIGVTGYLNFWDLDLDPVTLCAVVVSIGMSVDFVAHMACHYQTRYKEVEENGKIRKIEMKTPEARLMNAYSNILWPMIQSAFSTLLCVLPLAILSNYLPMVFVKTILLVVIWGLFHGLVLLPSILSQFPLRWFDITITSILLGSTPTNVSGAISSSESDSDDGSQEMIPLAVEP